MVKSIKTSGIGIGGKVPFIVMALNKKHQELICNVIFYTVILLIPTTEISIQIYEYIHSNSDMHFNEVLEGEGKFPDGLGGGWFTETIKDKHIGGKKLDLGENKFLKKLLHRKDVTKSLIHGFNMFVIIVTGAMIWFFEFRMLCKLRQFVTDKKGPLMLGALIFFVIASIAGTIILILINSKGDLDGHRDLYDTALKKLLAKGNMDTTDGDLHKNPVRLSTFTWFKILLECRRNEGDRPDLKTIFKTLKTNATQFSELLEHEKDLIPLVRLEKGKDYDIAWLKDLGLCPVDPGDYMWEEILEVIMLCYIPVLFFGVKLIRLYACQGAVAPESDAEQGDVSAAQSQVDGEPKPSENSQVGKDSVGANESANNLP